MRITSVEKYKGSMYNVYVDGEYFATFHIETILQQKIKENAEFDIQELENIKVISDTRRARERALHLLEYRSHSKKELYDKLKKNYDEDICESVIERLCDAGLLDDYAYALRMVEICLSKSYGKIRINAELKKRGIGSQTINDVLEEFDFDSNEELISLIERKYARYLGDEKGVNKVKNALMRMGYTYSQIKEAINAFTDEYDEYEDFSDNIF